MTNPKTRITIIGLVFLLLSLAVVVRLGHLQVVRHDYFSVLASQSHSRKFEIPAQRGNIFLQDRGQTVPVAMNRNLKTLYADTRYIYNQDRVVAKLNELLGTDYTDRIEQADGYVVLEEEVAYDIAQQIDELQLSGIGMSNNYTRVYPEGSLGSHLLGFVNRDGVGQYGVEDYYDEQLKGMPGLFDAETDARGIPLATADNVHTPALNGADIVLTIDRNIQAHVESTLKKAQTNMRARSVHALVMDPDTGDILAMANYPDFDPNHYSRVEDYSLFMNTAVAGMFEPGSGFKMFTMAAGLDAGAVEADTTYFDNVTVTVGDSTIRNPIGSPQTRNMTDVITSSLNTGVVFILERLGGGQINQTAKEKLYDYFVNHFGLADPTGIDLPGEPQLKVNAPDEVGVVNYANMTFGQGVTTTMVRMTTSMAAVINGGTLYRPNILDHQISPDGSVEKRQPVVVKEGVVSRQVSEDIKLMMENVVEEGGGFGTKIDGYRIGGKTGTAQIAGPEGGYLSGRYIGTFIGFAPVENPRYIMMVRIDEPNIVGFSGSQAAGPVFGEIMEWLLHYGGVTPQSD